MPGLRDTCVSDVSSNSQRIARECRYRGRTTGVPRELASRRRGNECPNPSPYNGRMITRGIRAFVARDWEAARESKASYWAERIDRLGAAEGLRIAEQLRRHVLACDPGWPHI